MYKNKPNKQDHGTRGCTRRKRYTYRYYRRSVVGFHAEQRKQRRNLQKSELNKISIDCTDEEIERYLLKGLPSPRGDWYYFD
jgi:hypothetical protein